MLEALARAMFERQAETWGADDALMELAWADPDIRAFWTKEAEFVWGFVCTYERQSDARTP